MNNKSFPQTGAKCACFIYYLIFSVMIITNWDIGDIINLPIHKMIEKGIERVNASEDS